MTPEDVRAFLLSRGAPVADVGIREPLFSSGRVDSFLLVDLLLFLETETGCSIDPGQLTLEQIDSLARLAVLGEGESCPPNASEMQ
ncbi:MAG: hypothetical protein JRI25_02290 [Deltaproteobacteria bacterium]|jgi:acyl carrier protein|nr:hypothetical protein [Deltaproteobacteria bacterium]